MPADVVASIIFIGYCFVCGMLFREFEILLNSLLEWDVRIKNIIVYLLKFFPYLPSFSVACSRLDSSMGKSYLYIRRHIQRTPWYWYKD